MKKNWFYLFLSMVITAMPLTSCDKDDDNVPKPETGEQETDAEKDQVAVVAYDALEWLQGSLVVVDKNNEVFRRVRGKVLEESQPTVISIPVKDYTAAETLFLNWVAPGKEATLVDGGYDYNLTDAEGNGQGSVSFRAEEGEAGMIARMSVAEGTALKQISEVKFIASDFWPENDDIPMVEAGKIYKRYDYELVWETVDEGGWNLELYLKKPELSLLSFYCIQSNTDGKEGILVWLCPDSDSMTRHPEPYRYFEQDAHLYLPTEDEAEMVLNFHNNNRTFWKNMQNYMDDLGYQWNCRWFVTGCTGNDEFLLNAYNSETNRIKFMDLDSKKGEIKEAKGSTQHTYRYMHIHIIPPYNE